MSYTQTAMLTRPPRKLDNPSEQEPPPLSETPETRKGIGVTEKPAETERPHAIETYKVGLPGAEKMVADTATGDQVGVRRFDVGDVTDVKRTAIEEGEEAALQSLAGQSPENKGAIAKGAIESSQAEGKDIAEISQLLEGQRDALLVVDAATIKNESISKEGLHLLIPKGELEKVKPRLEELGYSTKEIEQLGLEAKKGRSQFVFLYAKERGGISAKKESGLGVAAPEAKPKTEVGPSREQIETIKRELQEKAKHNFETKVKPLIDEIQKMAEKFPDLDPSFAESLKNDLANPDKFFTTSDFYGSDDEILIADFAQTKDMLSRALNGKGFENIYNNGVLSTRASLALDGNLTIIQGFGNWDVRAKSELTKRQQKKKMVESIEVV